MGALSPLSKGLYEAGGPLNGPFDSSSPRRRGGEWGRSPFVRPGGPDRGPAYLLGQPTSKKINPNPAAGAEGNRESPSAAQHPCHTPSFKCHQTAGAEVRSGRSPSIAPPTMALAPGRRWRSRRSRAAPLTLRLYAVFLRAIVTLKTPCLFPFPRVNG